MVYKSTKPKLTWIPSISAPIRASSTSSTRSSLHTRRSARLSREIQHRRRRGGPFIRNRTQLITETTSKVKRLLSISLRNFCGTRRPGSIEDEERDSTVRVLNHNWLEFLKVCIPSLLEFEPYLHSTIRTRVRFFDKRERELLVCLLLPTKNTILSKKGIVVYVCFVLRAVLHLHCALCIYLLRKYLLAPKCAVQVAGEWVITCAEHVQRRCDKNFKTSIRKAVWYNTISTPSFCFSARQYRRVLCISRQKINCEIRNKRRLNSGLSWWKFSFPLDEMGTESTN